MPVHLTPNDELPQPQRVVDHTREQADLREGFLAAVKAAILPTLVALAVVPITLTLLKSALIAAQKIFAERGDYFASSFMPGIGLGLLGLLYGAWLGRQLGAAATLGEASTWLIATVCVAVVLAAGIIAAFAVFGTVLTIVAISLTLLVAGALAAVWLVGRWNG